MAQRTVYWELPTTYSNGTAIPPEIIAKLVTHIFRDDVEVGVSDPGATSMVVTVDEIPGDTDAYYGRCEVDGVADDLSAPSEVVVLTIPFLVVSPPTGLRIS